MRFLADENFPAAAFARCSDEQRTLLTFDKDFGEIAFRRGLPVPCGVVLFRVIPQSPSEIAEVALAAMSAQSAWEGHFSVVTRERIRMTPLPRK